MDKLPRRYRSYVLLLWQEGEGSAWRASLLLAPGGLRHGFADLEHLFAFLTAETQDAVIGDRDEGEPQADQPPAGATDPADS